MTFQELKQCLMALFDNEPPLTINDAIIACFSARLPQDSGVYRDTRTITVIATIETYIDILVLCCESLKKHHAIKNNIVFFTHEIMIADFYKTNVLAKPKHLDAGARKAAFIQAAKNFLSLYNDTSTKDDDVSVINIRKLAPVRHNLQVLALELLSFEEVNHAPKKT